METVFAVLWKQKNAEKNTAKTIIWVCLNDDKKNTSLHVQIFFKLQSKYLLIYIIKYCLMWC